MAGWSRVVVGVDGSAESERALRWAYQEAQTHGAELSVVGVGVRRAPGGGPPAFAGSTWVADIAGPEDTAPDLESAVRSVLGVEAGTVRCEVVEGNPGSALIEAADGADLLVVGSRGRGAFAGMLLGSVSLHVVTNASCPVAVARIVTETQEGRTMSGRSRVVVGVDGSTESEKALRWAHEEAQTHGAELLVVGVRVLRAPRSSPPPLGGFTWSAEVAGSGDTAALMESSVRSVLGEEAQAVRTEVVEGNPASALINAANGADLLVVGSRGHGAFAGVLLGSVSMHVVTNADCPVIVVR